MRHLVTSLVLATGLVACAGDASRLIPFQCKLSGVGGTPLPDGQALLQFQIYGDVTAGDLLWTGEIHRVTINGGLVNVMLGSKNPLPMDRADQPDKSFFDQTLYLQIRRDSNENGRIDDKDETLTPRQAILPVVFATEAANSRKLDGHDWSVILADGATNPATGRIDGTKLSRGSVNGSQIAPAAITGKQIAEASLDGRNLSPESIDISRLAAAVAEALVPPGTVVAYAGRLSGRVNGLALPAGWLLCDGLAYRIQDYPKLYDVIKTSWGNGTTTSQPNAPVYPSDGFNVPDLRGLFLRGASIGAVRLDPEGRQIDASRFVRFPSSVGANANDAEVGSLQLDAFQGHAHEFFFKSFQSPGGGDPANQSVYRFDAGGAPNVNALEQEMVRSPTTRNGFGVVRVSTETRPANAYVHYIIKY